MLIRGKSQSKKATYCMIPIIRHSRKGKTMETIKRSAVVRGEWGDEWAEHRGCLGQ